MGDLKTSRVLLVSAPRSESTASLLQTDLSASALRFYLDVSDDPGSGGLSVVLRGYDKISGKTVELTTGGAPITDPGTYAYDVNPNYPSTTDVFGNLRESAARSVPYQWDAIVKHLDGSLWTYSLSVEIVK